MGLEQTLAMRGLVREGIEINAGSNDLATSPRFADGTADTYKLRQMHTHLQNQGLHFTGTDTVGKTEGHAGKRIHRYADDEGNVKAGIHEDTGFDGAHSFATPDNKVDHKQGKAYNSALDAEAKRKQKMQQARPETDYYTNSNKLHPKFT